MSEGGISMKKATGFGEDNKSKDFVVFKDKNGKDVHVGDVCAFEYSYQGADLLFRKYHFAGKVEYNKDIAAFCVKVKEIYYPIYAMHAGTLEVLQRDSNGDLILSPKVEIGMWQDASCSDYYHRLHKIADAIPKEEMGSYSSDWEKAAIEYWKEYKEINDITVKVEFD